MVNDNQILIVLGELKGQMSSIQGFLVSQSERMDRQDERMDKLEAHLDETKSSIDERLRHTENRMAKWAGIGAVILFVLPYVAKIFLGA